MPSKHRKKQKKRMQSGEKQAAQERLGFEKQAAQKRLEDAAFFEQFEGRARIEKSKTMLVSDISLDRLHKPRN